jgi:hypothetical protein
LDEKRELACQQGMLLTVLYVPLAEMAREKKDRSRVVATLDRTTKVGRKT